LSEEKESTQHVEHRFTNQEFKLTRTHGDRTTEFKFSSPPRNFQTELTKITSWLPLLEERLKITHHEEEHENVTRLDFATNPTYTMLWHDRIIYADCTDGEITITLHRAVDSRRVLIIKTDDSANHVVIQAYTSVIGNDTIQGDASISLDAQYDKVRLVGDSNLHQWYKEDI
jgi:hypothetical protein